MPDLNVNMNMVLILISDVPRFKVAIKTKKMNKEGKGMTSLVTYTLQINSGVGDWQDSKYMFKLQNTKILY